MGKVSDSARIVSLKIVYFGAAGVGKTTNLERLRSRTTSESRPSDLISLDHEGDKTLMFDWTPIRAGHGASYDVRLQVYAVPGKPKQESTKRRLLRDADGIVFILDSGPDKLSENRAAWLELSDHLQALGLSRERIPLVIQLNKRDLPNAMHGDDLRARLGMGGFPIVEAVAKGSAGVGATLLDITRRAVRTLADAGRTGGGEPLSLADISRIESTALPDAFAASGLLARRPKHTPGPVAAEEVAAASSHRSHDSARMDPRSEATPSRSKSSEPKSEPRAIEGRPVEKLAAQAIGAEPRAVTAPLAAAVIAAGTSAPAPTLGSGHTVHATSTKSGPPKEHATQRLMPAALVSLPRIESGNFAPPARPERAVPLFTPLSPGALDRAVPEEAIGLPLVDAQGPGRGVHLAATAAAPALRPRHTPHPASETRGLDEAGSVASAGSDGSEIRKVEPRQSEPETLSPPRVTEESLRDDRSEPSLSTSESADMAKIVRESEARVMARLTQVEEQIADLRGLLLQVSEQVRRVSSAPPESEARLTKLVREALGQIELTATLRAK
jgi:hypothetical protein